MFEKNNSETYEGGYLKKVVIEKTTIYMHQCNKDMIKDLCISINAQLCGGFLHGKSKHTYIIELSCDVVLYQSSTFYIYFILNPLMNDVTLLFYSEQ